MQLTTPIGFLILGFFPLHSKGFFLSFSCCIGYRLPVTVSALDMTRSGELQRVVVAVVVVVDRSFVLCSFG